MTARLFGVGPELDGYNLALVIPTLISGILSGMIQTGLFPVRAQLAARGNEREALRLEQLVLYGVASVAIAASFILWLSRTLWSTWLAPNVPINVQHAFMLVLPLALLFLPFSCISETAGYFLAIRGRYWIAAAAPIGNSFIGACLLLAWPKGGLIALALAAVIGQVLQACICLLALPRSFFSTQDLSLGNKDITNNLKTLMRLGMWILPALVFSNITVSIAPVLVAGYGEGAVAAFGYAYRLHQVVFQVLVMAIAPILLAHIATLASTRQASVLRRILLEAAGWSMAIGVVAATVVGMVGAQLLEFVFSGRFDQVAAERVALHWYWLTVGLAFSIFGGILARFWQGSGRAQHLSVFGFAQLITFLSAFSALAAVGEQAVAVALSASTAITIVVNVPPLILWLRSTKIDSHKDTKTC